MGPEAIFLYGHEYANPILEGLEFPKFVSPDSKVVRDIEARMKNFLKPGMRMGRLSVASGETLFRQDIKGTDRRAWLKVSIYAVIESRRGYSQPVADIWYFKISEKEVREAYSFDGINESRQKEIRENVSFFLSVMGFSLVDAMKRGFAKDIDIEVSELGLEYHFNEKCKADAFSTALQILLPKGKSGFWNFR
jgi:hypothetical protein